MPCGFLEMGQKREEFSLSLFQKGGTFRLDKQADGRPQKAEKRSRKVGLAPHTYTLTRTLALWFWPLT